MSTHAQRLGGFTLIELLVVISIVAILSAMSLSALSVAKGAVDQAKCGNNQRQLAQMVLMYTADYNSILPNWTQPGGINRFWWTKLIDSDYLTVKEVQVPLGVNMGSGSGRITCCPQTGKQSITVLTYQEIPAATAGYTPSSYGTALRVLGFHATLERSVRSVGATSLAPLFVDALMRSTFPWEGYSNFANYGPANFAVQVCGLPGISPRHRGRSVQSFLDGHVDGFRHDMSAYSDADWLTMYHP
jgi:prepilin-type N-terminal cleavage/methylation domain-containing protein/prepilin-type processing-associated H-X9-DG protein